MIATPPSGRPSPRPLPERRQGPEAGPIGVGRRFFYRLVVFDTNVIVSALRSSRGASHRLLRLVGTGRFSLQVSVPLVLEYESAAKRLTGTGQITGEDIDDIIDYLCVVGGRTEVFYLWRPCLRDPADDMVLETAVAAGATRIITFNKADFAGSAQFGVELRTPAEFLREIGEIP